MSATAAAAALAATAATPGRGSTAYGGTAFSPLVAAPAVLERPRHRDEGMEPGRSGSHSAVRGLEVRGRASNVTSNTSLQHGFSEHKTTAGPFLATGPSWATCFVETLEFGKNVLEEWVMRDDRAGADDFREWRSKCGPGPSRGRCEPLAPAASDEVTCLQCLVRAGDMALGALTAPSARAAHPDQPVGWGKAVEGPAVLPKGPERESGEQLFWRCLTFLEDASEAWTAHDELCWQAHLARTMRHLGLSWFMAECIDHLKQYVSESVAAQVCSLLWMEGGGVRLCLPASPAFVRPRWGGWGFRTDNCIEGLFNSALGWYLGADVSEKEVSKIMDVVTQGGRHGILAENVLSPEVLWGLNTLDTPLSETNFRETVASALGCDSDSLPGATQFCAALRDRMLQDLFVAEQGVLLGVDQSGQDRGQYAEGRQAIIPSEVTCILAPGPWPP